jgi:hypothetical protein
VVDGTGLGIGIGIGIGIGLGIDRLDQCLLSSHLAELNVSSFRGASERFPERFSEEAVAPSMERIELTWWEWQRVATAVLGLR